MAVYKKVAFLVTELIVFIRNFCDTHKLRILVTDNALWCSWVFLCNNEGKSMWEVFYRCKVLIFMKNEVFLDTFKSYLSLCDNTHGYCTPALTHNHPAAP